MYLPVLGAALLAGAVVLLQSVPGGTVLTSGSGGSSSSKAGALRGAPTGASMGRGKTSRRADSPGRRAVLFVVVAAVLCCGCTLTFLRCRDWQDPERLTAASSENNPGNARMWFDKAKLLAAKNADPEDVEKAYDRALELWPTYVKALFDLGNFHMAHARVSRVPQLFGSQPDHKQAPHARPRSLPTRVAISTPVRSLYSSAWLLCPWMRKMRLLMTSCCMAAPTTSSVTLRKR